MESTNPICKQLSELLDAFRDGELHGQERAQVEAHLKDCAACTEKIAGINQLVSMLKTMPIETPREGFSARVDASIDQHLKVVPMRRRATWAAGAVAAAAVIAVGFHFAGPGQQSAPTVANVPNAPQQVEVANKNTPQPIIVKHQAEAPQIAILPSEVSPNVAHTEVPRAHESVATHYPSGEAVTTSVPKHASNESHSLPSTTHGGTEIASVPSQGANLIKNNYNSAGSASAGATDSGVNSAEIAELPVSTNSFNEAVGLSTDEDGLYDIKM